MNAPPLRTFSLATLGCKVNQVEAERLRRAFLAAGFAEARFGEPADATVVNTCTVTGRADRECRALLLRARRASPDGLVVLAGCLIDRGEAGRHQARGADLLLGNAEKDGLVARVVEELTRRARPVVGAQHAAPGSPPGAGAQHAAPLRNPTPETRYPEPAFLGRARAFLKVQDGCDAGCAYCIVPSVRGRSRSVPAEAVIAEAREYVGAGFAELVLTGIHLGGWGKDLPGRPALVGLCRAIVDAVVWHSRPRLCGSSEPSQPGTAGGGCATQTGNALPRLRLSSIEPGEVTEGLIAWLRDSPAACHHLHVPLQSGDPNVLAAMNRSYTPDEYRALLARVREALPDACLGADVLVGFPGETDARFANTRRFIEESPLDYLHVFPFSPREGTPAASMPGRIDPRVVRARAAELRAISKTKRDAFARRFEGKTVEVLVEKTGEDEQGPWATGLTRNYVRVTMRGGTWEPGTIQEIEWRTASLGGSIGAHGVRRNAEVEGDQ